MSLRDVARVYPAGRGEVAALVGREPRGPRGREAGDHGPLGLGQDDAALDPRAASTARRAASTSSRGRSVAALGRRHPVAAAEPFDRIRLPVLPPASPPLGGRERRDPDAVRRASACASGGRGPSRPSSGWASPTAPTTGPRSSPGARPSGRRSPAPSWSSRVSSSPTSPPATSTPEPAREIAGLLDELHAPGGDGGPRDPQRGAGARRRAPGDAERRPCRDEEHP